MISKFQSSIKKSKISLADLLFFVIIIDMVLFGAGRVIAIGPLTLRYVLFASSILYSIFMLILNRKKVNQKLLLIYLFFILSIFLSFVLGMVYSHSLSDIFTQGIGYIFIFMSLGYICYLKNEKNIYKIFRLFEKCVVILSFIILLIFLYTLLIGYNESLNLFLINKQLGHIAMIENIPRIFFKNSIYCAIISVYRIFTLVYKSKKINLIYLVNTLVTLLAALVSFTMGIWLGMLVSFIVLFLLINNKKKKKILKISLVSSIPVLLFFGTYIFDVLAVRLQSNDSSLIIKTDQLLVMVDIWIKKPLFGTGYGNVVVFDTIFGIREMLTIENTWAEMLATMGLFGIITIFILITFMLTNFIRFFIKTDNMKLKLIIAGLVTGIVQICVTSAFNPFLNNSIGLGFIGISLGVLNFILSKNMLERKKRSG